VTGTVSLKDGTSEEITTQTLTGAPETTLRLLAAAMVSLAAALVVLRF
jgi:hypothetical protein